jgi:hypothetical protein
LQDWVRKDHKDHKASLVHKDHKVSLAHKVLKVQLVLLVLKVHLVRLVLQVVVVAVESVLFSSQQMVGHNRTHPI